jgi:hypothetical protein
MAAITCEVLIERKRGNVPAFVVVAASAIAKWRLAGTTTVVGTLDGEPLGRRSLKRLDDERWFVELRPETLDAIEKGPGERAKLRLEVAPTELPKELAELIERDASAREKWLALTESQRRMLREEVLGAKSSAARQRRAERALQQVSAPAKPRANRSAAAYASITVEITSQRLPGRVCGFYRDVAVGLADKSGAIEGLVAADADRVRWTTVVEVSDDTSAPSIRGPAVQGPPEQRFIYLEWIGRHGAAPAARFRRAKLRLDAVPARVLAAARRSGVLRGDVDLVAPDGMPACASILPPRITWTSG